MTFTAQIESYTDCLEEMKAIYPQHWEALALNKDKVPLDPDYETYLVMDAEGALLCATIRNETGLVGYFIGLVNPGLHYRTCLTLTMDIFWVCPDIRGPGKGLGAENMAGVKLFRCVEKEARRRGVQRIFYGSKVHQDASRLFEFLGCEKAEVFYSKWIGE